MNLNSVFFLKLPQAFPRERLGELLHHLIPRDCFRTVILPHHRNAFVHRTDEEAEGTADTIRLTDLRLMFAVEGDEIDALMRAVLTSDVTEIALNALRFIDLRDGLVEKIQIAEI